MNSRFVAEADDVVPLGAPTRTEDLTSEEDAASAARARKVMEGDVMLDSRSDGEAGDLLARIDEITDAVEAITYRIGQLEGSRADDQGRDPDGKFASGGGSGGGESGKVHKFKGAESKISKSGVTTHSRTIQHEKPRGSFHGKRTETMQVEPGGDVYTKSRHGLHSVHKSVEEAAKHLGWDAED